MKRYRITTQRELRREFWETFPELSRKRIKNYAGDSLMYVTDTRCAFVDWVDALQKAGEISPELAERCTL